MLKWGCLKCKFGGTLYELSKGKCTKPGNSQNLTIGCFILNMANGKSFSWRVYSAYEEIRKILNVW